MLDLILNIHHRVLDEPLVGKAIRPNAVKIDRDTEMETHRVALLVSAVDDDLKLA